MRKLAVFMVTILIIVACEENYLRFEEAQPTSTKALSAFPKQLQGTYFACTDSSNKRLVIQEQSIQTHTHYAIEILRDSLELDSGMTLDIYDDEALIAEFKKEGIAISIRNDTIFSDIHKTHTLFKISSTGILKKFKGNYFLNQQQADNYWKVKRLQIKGDSLFIGTITATDSLLSSRFIMEEDTTESDVDSTRFQYEVANPSKKELKEWLKTRDHSASFCYCKQKEVE